MLGSLTGQRKESGEERDLPLAGQLAVVTGATGSIGSAIAMKLAGLGADIAVHYHSNRTRAEELCIALEGKGRQVVVEQADIANPSEVKAMADRIYSVLGGVDILVNNAGVCRDKLFVLMATEDWDQVLNNNLSGALFAAQAFIPSMLKKRSGRIINVSSITGLVPQKMRCNYGASKRALIGMTRCLARELSPKGILVNAVAPQVIEGGLTEHASKKELKVVQSLTPVGRLGAPDDVAGAVAFLAGDQSSFINGAVLNITGGLVTWQV